jgi:hypothetical protein
MALARRPFLTRIGSTGLLPQTSQNRLRLIENQLSQFARQFNDQDEVFQKQAGFRLERISQQLDELLRHELSFAQTETWRTVYQSILSHCGARRYLSVALIEHEDYWRDQPGQASLEFNYELVQHGFYVHRRFIIDEFFWPPGAVHPAGEILSSIEEQATHGIDVTLVRKSDLEAEPTLIRDFGIYGDRAVGYQSLDDQARTMRYVLRFGKQAIEEAEELWRQLDLYAVPLDELLERRA